MCHDQYRARWLAARIHRGVAVEVLGSKTTRLVVVCAFDLLELNGDDLRRDPLEARKATLAVILAKASPGIRFNEHIEGDGPTVFAHACRAMCASCGWLRRLANTPYQPDATTLTFSRSRSVTSCRNREFSSWSLAIRSSAARVRSGSFASGVTTNAR